MTHKLLITLSAIVFLLPGCREYAYYQSPFQSNSSAYKTMPTQNSEKPAETYVSGAFLGGGANHRWRDGLLGFIGSGHRGHRFGNFRAFYGLDVTLGGYRVSPFFDDSPNSFGNKYPNDSLINTRAGNKFFGGVGASGGIYITMPFNDGGEWRILGTEMSWQNEFGDYLSFRKNLPDTAANFNNKHPNFLTFGIFTDFDFKSRRGTTGFRFGPVFATRKDVLNYDTLESRRVSTGYYSFTFHLTRDRITGYWQTNLGTWASSMMLGINYRL